MEGIFPLRLRWPKGYNPVRWGVPLGGVRVDLRTIFVALVVSCVAAPAFAGDSPEMLKSSDGFTLDLPKGYEEMFATGGVSAMIVGPGKGRDRPVVNIRVDADAADFEDYCDGAKSGIRKDYSGAQTDSMERTSCTNAAGRIYAFSRPGQDSILLGVIDGGGRKYVLTGRAPVVQARAFRTAFSDIVSSMRIAKAAGPTGGKPPTPEGGTPATPETPPTGSTEPTTSGSSGFENIFGGGSSGDGEEGPSFKVDPLGTEVRCEPAGLSVRGPAGWEYDTVEKPTASWLQFSGIPGGGLPVTIYVRRVWTDKGLQQYVSDIEERIKAASENYKVILSRAVKVGDAEWMEVKASYDRGVGDDKMTYVVLQRLLDADGSIIRFVVHAPKTSYGKFEETFTKSADSIRIFGSGYRGSSGGRRRFGSPKVVLRLGDWKFRHDVDNGRLKLDLRPAASSGVVEGHVVVHPWQGSFKSYVSRLRTQLGATKGISDIIEEEAVAGGRAAMRFDANMTVKESDYRLIYKMVHKEDEKAVYLLAIVLREKDYVKLQSHSDALNSLLNSFRPADD